MERSRTELSCIVPGCNSTYFSGCGIRFHLFPNENEKKKRWLSRLKLLPDDDYDNAIICDLHFKDSDHYNNNPKNKLKGFALPNLSVYETRSISDSEFESSTDAEETLEILNENSSESKHGSKSNDKIKMLSKAEKVIMNENLKEEQNFYNEVCRICLVTGCKMYSIKQHNLENAYLQLTGISQEMFDDSKMPQTICFECFKRLNNFIEFSTKSLTAWSLLVELIEEDELTMDKIKDINRQHNLLSSGLTFTILQPNYFDIQVEEYYENDNDADYENNKIETDDIVLDNSFDSKEELRNQNNKRLNDVVDGKRCNNELRKNENNKTPSRKTWNGKKHGNKNEFRQLIKEGCHRENENSLSNWCQSQNKSRVLQIDGENDLIRPKKGRKSSERYTKEFNGMFTIKIMTPAEQKAEIESRQNSSTYQNAVFKCYKCFKGFNFEAPFNDHMKKHTNESGEFVCEVCQVHFMTHRSLTRHLSSRHKTYFECRLCPFKSAWRSLAADHKLSHEGRRYTCPQCPSAFANCKTFRSHIQTAHPEEAACQLCGNSYSGILNLENHLRSVHDGEDAELPDTSPHCTICNIRFRDETALEVHMAVSENHGDLEGSNISPGDLDEQGSLGTVTCEQLLQNAPYCATCDIHFLDEASLRAHVTVSVNHGNSDNPISPGIHYILPDSNILHGTPNIPTFPKMSPENPQILESNVLHDTPNIPPGFPKISPENPQLPESKVLHDTPNIPHGFPKIRPVNPKISAENPKLPESKVLHDTPNIPPGFPKMPPGNPKITPGNPQSVFKSRVYQRKKRKTRPTGPITCEQCGVVSPDMRSYIKHFHDAHPNRTRTQYSRALPVYMCELCGNMFQNITVLNDHRQSHSGERSHACERCPSAFKTKHDLRVHMLNHTRSRRCHHCGNIYATIGGLIRHMMIHTGKPYACEPCNKRFCTPSAKRAHIRHTHLREPWPKKRPKGQAAGWQRGGKSDADLMDIMEMELGEFVPTE